MAKLYIEPLDIDPQRPNESDHHFEMRVNAAWRKKFGLVVCPECDGDGYFEVVNRLTYDGYVGTKGVKCPLCDGSGEVSNEQYDEWEKEQSE